VILRSNEFLNAAASARYDAFPSLHVLVTLTLLRMDWREKRWRFWTMLGPSLVMIASTLALRLHYAVDLLASAILFALLCVFWRRDPAERLSR
jgi:membrane-associated phospholipid phosphatase